MLRTGFDNLGKISSIQIPKLLLHGLIDELIPSTMSEELYEAAMEPKELALYERAGHNDLSDLHGPAILKRISEFLRSISA